MVELDVVPTSLHSTLHSLQFQFNHTPNLYTGVSTPELSSDGGFPWQLGFHSTPLLSAPPCHQLVGHMVSQIADVSWTRWPFLSSRMLDDHHCNCTGLIMISQKYKDIRANQLLWNRRSGWYYYFVAVGMNEDKRLPAAVRAPSLRNSNCDWTTDWTMTVWMWGMSSE